ncbi:MAG: class I SAM-dependent methyltransferase [Planctomycetota bacterium]|jgi:SAM-dependent methyltransferase
MGKEPRTHQEVLGYWRDPPEGEQKLEHYAKGVRKRIGMLEMALKKIPGVTPTSSILELGCNVGRNLECLRRLGYANLSGVEISSRWLLKTPELFPELHSLVTFYNVPVEQFLSMPHQKYDVIFTIATLMHIHPDAEWIFQSVSRMAELGVVSIEKEGRVQQPRYFGRNYRTCYEQGGLLRQVWEGSEKINSRPFIIRVFVPNDTCNNTSEDGV